MDLVAFSSDDDDDDEDELQECLMFDGYKDEWPNKNARVDVRHAVTPLRSMPVIHTRTHKIIPHC